MLLNPTKVHLTEKTDQVREVTVKTEEIWGHANKHKCFSFKNSSVNDLKVYEVTTCLIANVIFNYQIFDVIKDYQTDGPSCPSASNYCLKTGKLRIMLTEIKLWSVCGWCQFKLELAAVVVLNMLHYIKTKLHHVMVSCFTLVCVAGVINKDDFHCVGPLTKAKTKI